MLRSYDTWNPTLLIVTNHDEDESIQRKRCFIISLSRIQIQRNDNCPPSQMWKDLSIIHNQLVQLVHSSLSLRHSFAVPLIATLTWQVFMVLFMLERHTVLHESLWFFSQVPSTHIQPTPLLQHASF